MRGSSTLALTPLPDPVQTRGRAGLAVGASPGRGAPCPPPAREGEPHVQDTAWLCSCRRRVGSRLIRA